MNINDLPEVVVADILRHAIDKKQYNVAHIESACYFWHRLVDKYCLWKEIAGKKYVTCKYPMDPPG